VFCLDLAKKAMISLYSIKILLVQHYPMSNSNVLTNRSRVILLKIKIGHRDDGYINVP
jgi:hypothetical protein